ncbi:Got1-domain-containing protein [Conidiobolus coronatus NRRL 28638]|uniref:Got1-domain-containing protein n=1 Tax=Conidiobolus coronatus (strain ATCC 28846 / CBS 209.66 / NRRL 28638) TaxID=796925 RepID=A0A137PAM9_CONC2|nr:Got1-domain-containing protein [Conidiobolus coronatus NRRL 28638]|eukprot:KXN72035.1 Got1-domain-containing protein [Conidiobolus coronatus NRRL 28638]
MWLSDTQKIGAGLASFGLFFIFLGVLYLFDSGLMVIGNLLFLVGLGAIMGFDRTIVFFSRRDRLMGTICFVVGILLLFITWAPIGFAVEFFGFINLFGDFFPTIVNFIRGLPYIGTLLSLPGISRIVDQITGPKQSPV